MRRLDVYLRFLLKLPLKIRLGVAVFCVVFFLLLYMIIPQAARTPSMLAIPVALVAWMFRKRGAFICLAGMVSILTMSHYTGVLRFERDCPIIGRISQSNGRLFCNYVAVSFRTCV